MHFNFFSQKNSTTLDDFIASTEINGWHYLSSLNIPAHRVHQATHEMIIDNIGDVLTGVTKVEAVLDDDFFSLFKTLIIKHYDSGEIKLQFNSIITDAGQVIEFYNKIKTLLGPGIHYQPKFAFFEDSAKVTSLASGIYHNESDEILQIWQRGDFTFLLNYKGDPLRQLLFSVSHKQKQPKDSLLRKNGNLLDLLQHNIQEVFQTQERSAESYYENGTLKYIDYSFELSPPELGLFELVKIRIFGQLKDISTNKSLLVTYLSRFEPDTSAIIALCDRLCTIYGPDDQGYLELRPHEIDHLDNSENWPGRSWFINQAHGLQDFSDTTQHTLYWISLVSNPDDEGLALCVLGFDAMQDYAAKKGDT